MTAIRTILAIALLTCAQRASAQQTLNCSEHDIGVIQAAQVQAGLMLLTTGGYLADLRAGGDTARFDFWYGAHSSEQLDFVENIATQVYYVMDQVTYDCDCDTGESERLAYVRTSDPRFHLRMCPLFFSSSDFIDEQVATIVHEFSHFFGTRDCMDPNIVLPCGSSDPVPFGAQGAHDFAVSDPYTSSWNAYNFERFVTDSGRPR
jgi:hypothetical protein